MTRFIRNAALVALLASSSSTTHAFTIELAATGQFAVQGSATYRSIEPPVAFLVQPSPFGRPVFITSGPLAARLLDPKRISRDAADPEVIRVDTSGSQEDFLSVRLEGPNIIVDRDGLTMTVKEGPPLLGDRTLDELIAALPEYRRDAARYTPDPAALETLRRVKQPTELLVFFGSWCPHCELAVPRLVRVLEDVHGAPLAVTFHGVPHDGWASDPMAENLRITGLPTVIVRRDSKEVARMEGDQWAAPEKSLAALVATPARR
jgi:thiol-disulfide isomerase/thioredoxin